MPGAKQVALIGSLETQACSYLLLSVKLGVPVLRMQSSRISPQVVGMPAMFTVALACHIGDRPGTRLCAPDAAIQAQVVWHVSSAATVVSAVLLLTDVPESRHALPSEA